MKQGTVRSHGPIVRPHMSLGAFRDAFCQHPRDRTIPSRNRAGAKSKLQFLLTVQRHSVPRDRTVPSGRTKMKFQVSGFRYNEPLFLNDKEFRTDLDCDTGIGLSSANQLYNTFSESILKARNALY
ncbi:hypothetical protein PIB30_075503 [Stylosanthes scabra]|uniref:Uncharacterized protein n=1 Tax=Stylosanthes scabra TaxID=79078 RepID=A0ABU6SQ62_9FABA|nr:hypothetical protein [Stylosanthes scabra]